MFTQKLGFLIASGALLLCSAVQAQDYHPELPIETSDYSITHAKPGGFVLARACKTCPMLSLQFDADSKVLHNGTVMSLKSIPQNSKTGITIIYDPKTKIVKRVFW
jgi:hypothetical protein